MDQASFKITKILAREVKKLRKGGCSWRMVATRFHEAHADLPVLPGNQIEGMCLCEEAAKVLKEDQYKW